MRKRMTSRARAQRLRAAMLDKLVERYIARYGHGV